MTGAEALHRLFSRATTTSLFLVLLALLVASLVTYLQDRHLQSVSLGALRMSSWNLAQLGKEASDFDREMALAMAGQGDTQDLVLTYDILWSRYDYLLNSQESSPTRQHHDNEPRLADLFESLQAIESEVFAVGGAPAAVAPTLHARWQDQKVAIEKLVIDNFVGDETGRLMSSLENSRDRLSALRLITFTALVIVFVYLALAMLFLRRQSRKDPVTGLANLRYMDTLKKIDPGRIVVSVGIKQFQVVLSEMGVATANALTCEFVNRVQAYLSGSGPLVQVSQSEFLVLAKLPPDTSLEAWVQQLSLAMTFQCSLGDMVIGVSGILGVDPPSQCDREEWQLRYQRAHRALVQADLDGCCYHINGADLRRRIQEERVIQQGLARFLRGENGSLSLNLVFQPIVSNRDEARIEGMEVLLRCRHSQLGAVPPNLVVEICERSGMGRDLGCWLFSQVAAEVRDLYRTRGFQGALSINLNPSMLGPDLIQDVQDLLLNDGLPADRLIMEITEDNAALDFRQINELIEALHRFGVRFALDDFGTGHSSLEYVRELRVDRLKIDRCFVDGIEHSADRRCFLESIIAMARQAYMKCVIEGVENQTQWALLAELDDLLIQGFYAYRPMPIAELEAILEGEWVGTG